MAKKQAAEGTDLEREASEDCSKAILEAYREYTHKKREELRTLSKGSKGWWKKCNELHAKKASVSHAPALKDEEGKWYRKPKEKADLFANAFSAKYKLNSEKENEYTALLALDLDTTDWNLGTQDEVEKTLAALREDSATGPDGLPTRLLKTCAVELAKPVHKLARNVLCSGRWPAGWCVHWIVPLHKKGSTWKPGNYRGEHLTAQLGKAVERFMQKSFGEHLCSEECSGANQFAYKTKRGARDLLVFLVLTWLHGFGQGKKYVLYCSDVAGAFDRVRLERLEEKLRSKKTGVP